VSQSGETEYLPSIAHLLKRAGALEEVSGIDVQAVSRLPVFQSRAWRRAIVEFLRWSGSTPEPWGGASVFDLMLCHGPGGARALFEGYRHDRLERAASFEEAEAQLEAVRTVVSMAAYWLHVIEWDLRDAPRLSSEEFKNRQRGRESNPGFREAGRESGTGVPRFPTDPTMPSLWKTR
jgi:hypothetical protein